MTNEKFNVVGTNIAEKATVIWNVADVLRGPFKPHEYGLVIRDEFQGLSEWFFRQRAGCVIEVRF
jgi:hypothetical protein